MADESVERARGGDVARHRDEADREQGQNDRCDDETSRGVDAVTESHGDGDVARHRGDRRRIGQRHEQHTEQADGAGLQLVVLGGGQLVISGECSTHSSDVPFARGCGCGGPNE